MISARIRHVLLVLQMALLTAQSLAAHPVVEAPAQILFEHLSTKEGLSHMSVNDIVQDELGFMWFATVEALNRYDGYEFKVLKHDPEDPDSLSEGFIEALYQDRSGLFWIGTRGGGLDRLDPVHERIVHYDHDPDDPEGLGDDVVFAVLEDRDDMLWIGTEKAGLERLDPETGRFTSYRHDPANPQSLAHDHVWSLYEDRAGYLWVGTWGGGLSRFDPATDGFISYRHDPADPASLSDDVVMAILEDGAGYLWVGTSSGGLNRLDPATGQFRHYRKAPDDPGGLSDDQVFTLLEDREGALWIGTGAGLDHYDPRGERFTHHRRQPGDSTTLSQNIVLSLYEDRAGTLWVGTWTGGVHLRDPFRPRFTYYGHDPQNPRGLSHDDVKAIYEDEDGGLWIGTAAGGLAQRDPATGEYRHYRHDDNDPTSLNHDVVLAIAGHRNGKIWIGTVGGLGLFDPPSGRIRRYVHDDADPTSLAHDVIHALCQDRAGRLWIGTFGGGLDLLERPDGPFRHYRHKADDPASLSHDQVVSITEDRFGELWIATWGGGLDRFDPETQRFRHYRHDPDDRQSLGRDHIVATYEDRSGVLWVATAGGGLNRFDRSRESFHHITTADGLVSDFVYSIAEDGLGRLWLSTDHGLSLFDPEGETWSHYDLRDGLQDNEFNMRAVHHGRSGLLYFGGINGLNAFRPEHFHTHPHLPPIVLTSFEVFGRERTSGRAAPYLKNIDLGHRQSFFSFEFAALDFIRPDKTRYSYKLEDLDADWVEAGSRRYASYTNVPPGSYTFKVRGSKADGRRSDEGLDIRVTVRPAPWKTRWAMALYAAVLFALVGSYIFGQKRKLEKERRVQGRLKNLVDERDQLIADLRASNADLESFNYTISHDLKTPLVTIKGFLGILKKDASIGDAKLLEEHVERIATATDHMHQLLEDLLELSQIGQPCDASKKIALTEVAREAATTLADAIAEKDVEIEIAPDLPIINGNHRRLLVVFTHIIENAVKFTDGEGRPRIEVGQRQDGEERIVYVRDNGRGIASRYQDKVFGLFERLDSGTSGTGIGLTLVSRIVEMHGGRIWVESEGRGRGSTFCLTLSSRGDFSP